MCVFNDRITKIKHFPGFVELACTGQMTSLGVVFKSVNSLLVFLGDAERQGLLVRLSCFFFNVSNVKYILPVTGGKF